MLRPVAGKPIDRRDVYRMVQRVANVARIPRHISPHSLRHAAITNALDAGVPLRDAQILARHADPRTTEHYDRARGNLDRHGVHFLTAYRRRMRGFGSASAPPRTLCVQLHDARLSASRPTARHLGARADDRVHRERHGEAAVAGRIMSGGDESLEITGVELARADNVLGELTHREAAVGGR